HISSAKDLDEHLSGNTRGYTDSPASWSMPALVHFVQVTDDCSHVTQGRVLLFSQMKIPNSWIEMQPPYRTELLVLSTRDVLHPMGPGRVKLFGCVAHCLGFALETRGLIGSHGSLAEDVFLDRQQCRS